MSSVFQVLLADAAVPPIIDAESPVLIISLIAVAIAVVALILIFRQRK